MFIVNFPEPEPTIVGHYANTKQTNPHLYLSMTPIGQAPRETIT